ncbi:MAG TPA: hypothetical protein VHU42_03890 [Rhodopila sp.]|jgi:hypothetical protein|nr:hypothetical protein [Rhodopila sp.]
MSDLPPEQISPENLSRPAARAAADRVEAAVSAGIVHDTPRVEAYVESLRTVASPRVTQAQREAARIQSRTSASSMATEAAHRHQQVQRPPRAIL